jgi:hypothetical protein
MRLPPKAPRQAIGLGCGACSGSGGDVKEPWGSHTGIYKGWGCGSPETRVNRHRGTHPGQMDGRGVFPNLERALEVSGTTLFQDQKPGDAKAEGGRRLLVRGWATSPGFAAPPIFVSSGFSSGVTSSRPEREERRGSHR